MEVFIRADNNGMVTYTHYRPFDKVVGMNKSRNELLKEGHLVPNIPEPKLLDGYRSVAYYDRTTNEVYHKYVEIPKTTDDKVKELEEKYKKDTESLNIQLTETQTALCDVYEMIASVFE